MGLVLGDRPIEHAVEGIQAALALVGAAIVAGLIRRDRRAEAALSATERLQRTTLDTIAEGVILFDVLPDGGLRATLANPAAADILGMDLSDVSAASPPGSWPQMVDEAGIPISFATSAIHRSARRGEVVFGAVRAYRRTPEGPMRWIRSSSRPVVDLNGTVTGVAFSFVDITAEHQAHQELAAAHARFAALVEHGTDLILVTDEDRQLSYASPALERVLGLNTALSTDAWTVIQVHPEDHRRVWEFVERVRTTPRQPLTSEWRVLSGHGTWRHLEVTGTNLFDDPAVKGVVWVGRDVTARREAEVARAASEELQRITFETVAEAVMLFEVEPGGRIRLAWINRAAQDLLGSPDMQAATEALMVAGTDHVVFGATGEPLRLRDSPMRVTARTGEAVEGFVWCWHRKPSPDGPGDVSKWFRTSTRPVTDADGTVTHVVASSVDITDTQLAHQRLEAAHARFAALVEQGTELIATVDADSVATYCSPAFKTLLGWEASELLGRPLHDLVHPDDQLRVSEFGRRLSESPGQTMMIEYRMARADGSWRHIEWTITNRLHDPPVHAVVASGRDVTERVEAARRLAHQANHDALTGLPNRTLLVDRLEQALARSGPAHPCAVFFVDLDQFKIINDSLGHAAGDQLLSITAERINAVLRSTDTVARLGGDEFVVVAEGVTGDQGAHALAGQIQRAVEQPAHLGGRTVTVSCSIGIATSGGGAEADSLLQHADLAMYRAKQRGRNRWVHYDQAMRSDVRRRLDAAELVRASLEADRVLVHYQVIVDLQTGTPAESEALVRLQDSDGRYVHPGEFIEVAEASGLIVPLGAAVLDLACAQQARWAASGSTLARVGVNISAHQLASPDLVDHVRRILAAHRLSGSQLCLELTESSLIDAGPATLAQVEELRGIGVTFAIDDFGTGWSSLSSLRRLPLDVMKIDRSFVSGLGRDEGDAEVVKALIGLSHSLGLTVVAEGVETAEQAAVLHRLGCERAQGHFYSRPQPAEDVRMTTPA